MCRRLYEKVGTRTEGDGCDVYVFSWPRTTPHIKSF